MAFANKKKAIISAIGIIGTVACIVTFIETPSFPTVARLFIVTLDGTKEAFAATANCVMVPAVFVDAPDGMERIPFLKLLKPKPAA